LKNLYVISKHILYNFGGAEKSILRYISKIDIKRKILIGFKNNNKEIVSTEKTEIEFIKPFVNLSKLYFFEYFLNKKVVHQKVEKLNNSHIITYGIYFPLVVNSSKNCFTELHIRSETDLGIFINYNLGIRYFIKEILKGIEFPFQYFYMKELKEAILNADKIVCNSMFIQKKLLKIYGRKSIVVYPQVNINKENFKNTKEGIVFIGDSRIKGLNLVKKIASKLPENDFFIFGRNTHVEKRIGNIIYCPWQADVLKIYKRAKLVIVPSLWQEAYGRVAKESIILDIPVLVSNVGGLAEAVDFDESKLVTNYTNSDEWIRKIKDII